MKNLSVYLVFAIALVFTGCKKDSSGTTPATNSSTTITNAGMTSAISNAVSSPGSGLATQSVSTAQMAASSTLGCGGTSDSAVTGASAPGDALTYNYDLNFSRTCMCTGGVPSQYNCTITGTSSYSILGISSSNTINGQFSVSGIQASATDYTVNENYTSKGTIQSTTTGTQYSFTYTLTFTSTNITILKSNMQIASGTAIVQFSGTSSTNSTPVTENATITFLGNNQATLAFANGTTTTITW